MSPRPGPDHVNAPAVGDHREKTHVVPLEKSPGAGKEVQHFGQGGVVGRGPVDLVQDHQVAGEGLFLVHHRIKKGEAGAVIDQRQGREAEAA